MHDVAAVNRRVDRAGYASRQKIYPKLARGTYRNLKWALMAVCLGIYYLIPWVRYDRGPDLPNQAVLLDMANNRFFLFGLEIWPQEFYYITGLLVLAALVLFVVNSIAGRVWCGYFCPQTVWTDLMVLVERFWQGDRNARIRLDKEPWGPSKIFKKGMTHLSWVAIAVATGGAFVFYFADAPTLARQLFNGTAPMEAYVFIAILASTTYLLGGIAREQVCIYMCPWPRIQGAMVDQDSLMISYRERRGEPRGPIRKSAGPERVTGDCIDCKACVAVCPMGIDIRDGFQAECIQCALCIDACDDIMLKIGRPTRLIAYDTIANQEAVAKGTTAPVNVFRVRTLLYLGLIAIVSLIMLGALWHRSVLEANVMADRNPLFVKLANGDIRNGFTLKILNKLHEPRTYSVGIEGLPDGARIIIAGQEKAEKPAIVVPTDVLSEVRVFVTVPSVSLGKLASQTEPFNFIVKDTASDTLATRKATFRRP
ncbi:MAG TPA: cytochrome c oxidase accessory protein CcoG [Hyphomicrobium sp.]|nr:cytochrome c oxidase accessory protein CcoG [Hyphomicrobium sp.]